MRTWPEGYACVQIVGIATDGYSLRPVEWADREPMRRWRNEQIEVLRQSAPLAEAEQDHYFESVVRTEMGQERPRQVLVGFLEHGVLIGYGGVVHISWEHRRGEVSFITATARQDPAQFSVDLRAFLALVIDLADRLGLHRLTTETYEFRDLFIAELERAGWVQEGRLRKHVMVDGRFIDSLAHGVILPGADRP